MAQKSRLLRHPPSATNSAEVAQLFEELAPVRAVQVFGRRNTEMGSTAQVARPTLHFDADRAQVRFPVSANSNPPS